MPNTLIATCGASLNGIHNVLFAHYTKGEHAIKRVVLLLTKQLLNSFFNDLVSLIQKTNDQMGWKLPLPEKQVIPGENLIEIRTAIGKILDKYDEFILDITAGRKVMAVGAAMAFDRAQVKNKVISYYLLKGDVVAPATDRLLQHLMADEWELQYYRP
ncbi:MAG: hypothetical protein D6732_18430 [Methanobacteriota archaeon]|nr:MAG: hypothetical protein D6732_18430 [Euryarchaeota archaeon]